MGCAENTITIETESIARNADKRPRDKAAHLAYLLNSATRRTAKAIGVTLDRLTTNRARGVTKVIAVQLHTVVADAPRSVAKIISVGPNRTIAYLTGGVPKIVGVASILLTAHAPGRVTKAIAVGIDPGACAVAKAVAGHRLREGCGAQQYQHHKPHQPESLKPEATGVIV